MRTLDLLQLIHVYLYRFDPSKLGLHHDADPTVGLDNQLLAVLPHVLVPMVQQGDHGLNRHCC